MMSGRKAKCRSGAVCLAVLPHFIVSSVVELLEQHVRVGMAHWRLSVSAHVVPAVAREIVHQRHVDHHMGFTCKVVVLNLHVALLSSTARGDGAAAVVKSPRLKTTSSADKMCSTI